MLKKEENQKGSGTQIKKKKIRKLEKKELDNHGGPWVPGRGGYSFQDNSRANKKQDSQQQENS